MGMCTALGRKPMLLEQCQVGRRWEEMRSGKEPKARTWPYRPLKGMWILESMKKWKRERVITPNNTIII